MSELRDKYQADADMMSTKSRFGYFSLPPSHTAAIPPPELPPRTHLDIQTPGEKTASPRRDRPTSSRDPTAPAA